MTDRIHMGTRGVWRWYFRPPVDSYETANWHRLPKFGVGGRETIDRNAPSKLAGKKLPFLSVAFHKRCWRIGRLPWRWDVEIVLDYIEENGGWPAVPSSPASIDKHDEGSFD